VALNAWLFGIAALWLACGWGAAFIHLPWKRIWAEPQPRLTIVALLLWGAAHGVLGLLVLYRGTSRG
jgi:hypothetical protein